MNPRRYKRVAALLLCALLTVLLAMPALAHHGEGCHGGGGGHGGCHAGGGGYGSAPGADAGGTGGDGAYGREAEPAAYGARHSKGCSRALVCPYEGCTLAGRHHHDGSAYCGQQHPDGSCADSAHCHGQSGHFAHHAYRWRW